MGMVMAMDTHTDMATITARGLLMLKLLLLLSLDTATLPMAMDTLLMDMLTMATITARGLLMLSLDIIIMAMDTLPMDTDMVTTMARDQLSLDTAMYMLMV